MIHRKRMATLVIGFFFSLMAIAQDTTCDVLIQNGKIIDGTSNGWYYGDVAVKDGKILAVARGLRYSASRTINAEGLIIAPGFIDVHTHIEEDEIENPLCTNFIYDGVTTVVTGNCGSSNVEIGNYLQWIDSLKLSVNVATLVGHNDVRKSAMGRVNRDPTEREMQMMDSIVAKAMLDGAVGLSTGLIYIPGTYAKTPEIISLAKTTAALGGVYASHIRNEGDRVTEAISEAIAIGREANLPVEISHFKLSGQQNWGRSRETVAMIASARLQGLDVTIDQYPYTASSTSLSTLLPDEILADGEDSVKARLQRPAIRKYVTKSMLKNLRKRKLKHYSYAVVANHEADTSYNGKSVEEINRMKGRKHKAKAETLTVMDIVSNGGASAVFHGMSEGDVRTIMQYPFNMFASDAGIIKFGSGVPHPRGYGTNARVLGNYVRQQKIISLEEAVRRMSSLPAQKFQLKNRGLLKEGFAADIVVFDENHVSDLATYQAPHAFSTGFHFVFVNGMLTMENSRHTGTRAGKALFGPAKQNQNTTPVGN